LSRQLRRGSRLADRRFRTDLAFHQPYAGCSGRPISDGASHDDLEIMSKGWHPAHRFGPGCTASDDGGISPFCAMVFYSPDAFSIWSHSVGPLHGPSFAKEAFSSAGSIHIVCRGMTS